jgi:DUF971 family protein
MENADLDATGTTLLVTWGDGARRAYPLLFLRSNCPCASCRTLREQNRDNSDPFRVIPGQLLQPNSEMTGVEPVGRYGMRITWGDGHDTGIYTFEYFRALDGLPEMKRATEALTNE